VLAATVAVFSLFGAFIVLGVAAPSVAADPCGAASNPVVCENSKPGTPRDQWDIGASAGDANIQGFATSISVKPGGTIGFKINTPAPSYSISIYRTGWYGGDGARHIADVTPSAALPQKQPTCVYATATETTDCGNWSLSASWTVPSSAVSGVYVADLIAPSIDGESQITFVVTDPNSHSDILLKTSDATWEAYNPYGGSDFYVGAANGRAYGISYNRPFSTRNIDNNQDFYFNTEYPLVEFLEENGYDVSYTTDVDTALNGAAAIEQHKVFISSGHDEYWSTQERANVEAARDAGVNLSFQSANSVYWHTTLAPSIDGTNTPNRTIVSYKDTWSGDWINPGSTWTGTWRDPRFATKAQGGSYPETALVGQEYMTQQQDEPMSITQAQGKLALWANTGLSSISASTTQVGQHLIGFEADEDVDNGFRPSGLIYLSTSTFNATQRLLDYGLNVGPGQSTTHMEMYRAASGALVFSSGTINYNWGLSDDHDGNVGSANRQIQQFEVNLLALMGAQPLTLTTGLVTGAGHTDTTPPTATITTPAAGSTIANGSSVTVSGTASDVGGIVAGVEVSSDGGQTWHMATGTTSWTYTYVQSGIGTATFQVRAVDDSANYAATPVSATYDVSGPYSIFGAAAPKTTDSGDTGAYEIGTEFTPTTTGVITGVRFYKSLQNTGTHLGHVWDTNGNLLGEVSFTGETASGWQTADFASAIPVTAGQSYVVSYSDPNGHYSADNSWDYRGVTAPPLTVAGGTGAQSGLYGGIGQFPTQSYENTNYFADAIFSTTDTTPLTAVNQWPLPSSSSVPLMTTVSAVMSRDISPSTLGFGLKDQNGNAITGVTAYNAATRTATFTPAQQLNGFVKYTATVTAKSSTGVTLSAGGSWTFTTVKPDPVAGVCPCGLYSDGTVPTELDDADPDAVTLGTRFTPSVDGTVTGVRFYKGPTNTGPHVGSLWTASGTLLASGSFTSESSSGWQTLIFSTPVSVTAGTEYVAGYRTTVGAYSVTAGGFPVSFGPLTADSGMYNYTDGFPGTTSTASYLVDVVFQKAAPTIAVTSEVPSQGAVNVSTDSTISLAVSSPLAGGYTVSVKNGSTNLDGTTMLSSDGLTATFIPSAALPTGAQISVSFGNLVGENGATLANQSWSFTTATVSAPPSYTLFGNTSPTVSAETGDPSSVEVGTAFTSSVPGQATGVRFYKGTTNTGAHVGHLWSSSGVLLATVNFTDESATGWQTASFSNPVTLTPGATYVVSYLAPHGNYAYTSNFFSTSAVSGPLSAPKSGLGNGNGLYLYTSSGGMPAFSWNATNYFVDVVFQPVGTDGPTPTPTSTPTPTDTPSSSSSPSGSLSIFNRATPDHTTVTDAGPVQVGVKFTTTSAGVITGISYYRSPDNVSADTVYLWSANGSLMGTANVPASTGSGWQTISFATPVALAAGGVYTASYYTSSAHYAYTANGLSSPVTSGPLTATSAQYVYGTGVPASSSKFNYWVDVAFSPAS
jgi:hypothetical protein